MEALIWIGTFCTCLGLVGLGLCIREAARARREDAGDEALKARLQKVVAWNLGALAISALGLMRVILGVVLA